MKITLILVGKTNDRLYAEGIDDYAKRINHYMPFNIKVIPDIKNSKSLNEEQQKTKEGELILKAIKPSDDVILLDEHGKEYSSVEWARALERRISNSGRDMVFVIGGAYGFSRQVYDRSNGLVSLSKMTFSHQMVRVIFIEQLYRAFTIMKGEPYHHE